MNYCADSWFIVALFNEDPKSLDILNQTKEGKTYLSIPIIVYAESIKKLMQRGVAKNIIDLFWQGVENSEKVNIINLNKSIGEEAAKISLSNNVPLIDSFVAATCKLTNCDYLLTGDDDYSVLVKKKYIKIYSW